MKKAFRFLPIALCALTLAACAKEIPMEEEPQGVNITINTGEDGTKTYIEYDDVNHKYVPRWNNGNKVGVFVDAIASNAKAPQSVLNNTAADGASASFTGTVDGLALGEHTVYAFYPAAAFSAAADGKVVGLSIPEIQRPTATSFDPAADVLVGEPYDFTYSGSDVVLDQFQFRRVGAIVKLVVTDGTAGGTISSDLIHSVTVTTNMANGAFTGRYKYDFTNKKAYHNNGGVNEHISPSSKSVTADVSSSPLAIGAPIYVIVNPQVLTSGSKLTFSVSTDKHDIVREAILPSNVTLAGGGMVAWTVNVQDSDQIDTAAQEPTQNGWHLVRKASWLNAGDRIVITDANSQKGLGVEGGSSPKYRTSVSVTGSDGKLTSVGDAIQLVLEAGSEDDSFALKDGDDYLNWTSGNSLTTTASKDASASWTVTIGAGGEASIVNAGDATRTIMYNAGSPRFACYTSGQTGTKIYKLYNLPALADLSITLTPDHANGKVTVTWTDVANATNYAVECTGEATQNIAPGVEQTEFTGLDYNTEYTITVTASAEGYSSSSDTKSITLIDPTGKSVAANKTDIWDVVSAGVTNAVENGVYSLTNAMDSDLTVVPDNTVVTAASVSGGALTYTVSENTGAARDGSVSITADGGNTVVINIHQRAGSTIKYVKVTNTSDITDGDTYLVVNEAASVALTGSETVAADIKAGTSVTISGGEIAASSEMDAIAITIVADANSGHVLRTASGYYIYNTSNTKNGFSANTGLTTANKYAVTLAIDGDGNADITAAGSYLRWNSGSSIFNFYKADTYLNQAPVQLYKRSAQAASNGTITSISHSDVGEAGANLSASFTDVWVSYAPQDAGFRIGLAENALSETVYTDDLLNSASGIFSATVMSLTASTTYYYQAFMTVWNGSAYVEITSSIQSFTTSAVQSHPAPATGWLELPSSAGAADFCGTTYGSGGSNPANRNYSFNYSYSRYASLWVAYPLSGSHKTGTAKTSSWRYYPGIPESKQVKIVSNSYGTMYCDNTYSRGHQCPNASRKSDSQMNMQTYYSINQTPQRQENFNGSIWGSLEGAVRSLVTSATDTVYVATGPVYQTVGGNEPVNYLTGAAGKNANPASLPIPNYFWKAILKVKRNGSGEITNAKAIGFWFQHKDYAKNTPYSDYAVSVDYIEQLTGFDLFTNLPDDIEATAESNTSWSSFQSF